jgi:hypothetical protein
MDRWFAETIQQKLRRVWQITILKDSGCNANPPMNGFQTGSWGNPCKEFLSKVQTTLLVIT